MKAQRIRTAEATATLLCFAGIGALYVLVLVFR
jgi:hypothetical protein